MENTDNAISSGSNEEARKIYDNFWAETNKRQLSNTENLDKTILTYSTAGLALSLAFLKETIRQEYPSNTWLLYTSWAFFVLSITTTVTSFLIGNKALEQKLDHFEKYLIEGNEEYKDKKTIFESAVNYANIASGVCFVIALALSTIFVGLNIEGYKKNIHASCSQKDVTPTAAQESLPQQKNSTPPTSTSPPSSKQPTTQKQPDSH